MQWDGNGNGIIYFDEKEELFELERCYICRWKNENEFAVFWMSDILC
jgi:hypothetical protein